MTLIEVGVALCVAGLMLAVAIPALSNVTRAQLRQKTGQLAGGVRSLYSAAAIAGHTCRLVLDLDQETYWSECAKGNVRLSREGERSQNGARLESREEELQAQSQRDNMSEEEREKLQHQPESYTSGRAFIYFWSSGLTEEAAIHLEQGGDVYSLLVSPLTGRVKVVGDRVDAPGQKR
jgi:general secretion pathway protein H